MIIYEITSSVNGYTYSIVRMFSSKIRRLLKSAGSIPAKRERILQDRKVAKFGNRCDEVCHLHVFLYKSGHLSAGGNRGAGCCDINTIGLIVVRRESLAGFGMAHAFRFPRAG